VVQWRLDEVHHYHSEQMTMTPTPKYVTFDCYGTLTRFRMGDVARKMFADRIPAERMEQFLADFTAYRFDECLGDWQPYETVLKNSLRRLCRKWKLQYLDTEAQKYYDAVPTWGPHEDVPAGLAKVAKEIPLVILSNAMDVQIPAQCREARRAVSPRVYRAAGPGVQATLEGVRVHVRLAGLQSRGRGACVVQLAL
jgi:2-haloalkanoic acid dehalogenase type II